jgi:dTDP-glucose 4,6-dehydratase
MEWQNRTVLVTGAGGFIGSHLAERLVSLRANTRALVRYNSANSWGWLDQSSIKNEIEVIAGDIRDRESLKQAIQGVDIIFHLAALIGIPYSYHSPTSYVRTNVAGTLNILQMALENDVKLVVHTSTSEVYGTACYVPIDEEHSLQGQSPYSASKIGADKMAEAFHLSFGLPVATIRPFNTYGPRQSARAIIPTIITQALTQPAIKIGNLLPTRDLSYVRDTVEAYIRIAECPDAIGKVINIGTGNEISVGDLASTILDLMGKNIPIKSDDQRIRPANSEVERLCAKNDKAQEILNWRPKHSLKQGLTETIEWIENHIDQYRPETYAI